MCCSSGLFNFGVAGLILVLLVGWLGWVLLVGFAHWNNWLVFLVRLVGLIGDVLVGVCVCVCVCCGWACCWWVWLDVLQRVGGLIELGWLVFGQWDCYFGIFDGGGGDGGGGLCAIGCGGLRLAL